MPAPITVTPAAVATWDVSAVDAERGAGGAPVPRPPARAALAGPLVLRARPRQPARRRRSPASRRTAIPSTCSKASSWPSRAAPDADGRIVNAVSTDDAARAAHRARDLRVAAAGLVGAAAVWPFLPVHPPLACPLRAATGIPCPLCGMTRACVAAVHGHLGDVARVQPGGRARGRRRVVAFVRPQLLTRMRVPMWIVVDRVRRAVAVEHRVQPDVPPAPLALAGSYLSASTSRRPSNARPSVTSSAYSRSPPTGSPLAMRVTSMPSGFSKPREVHRGRFALDVGVRREDDLVDAVLLDAREQLLDAQLLGADALDRRDRALEHVVAALELAGALDRDDVARLLDDAQRRARRGDRRGSTRTARLRRC